MAKDGKFGTFGGVFTPSILTILGVIMYLRLPWVVGNGGLQTTAIIIMVAHVISVSTGLSISSIATDKAVGAGGPYYIISRSLGLPLGGTIGIALFLGLSFSISLYIIGFSESLLSYLEIPADARAIRICGTATLVALTVLTFISTALAIRLQYVILALIGLSILSIFGGSPEAPAQLHWSRPAGGIEPYLLFGIFFPAVTGFTAGVNMSGDLRDARKSIPVGSMAAIVVGFLVYMALAAFLAFRVDPRLLREDPNILVAIAAVPMLVVAGVWGATLSSALGSILGAPRILQAVSADRITPAWFAKGTGKTNEPRNALVLAFVLGEAGILIAELDVIARIVSMVFLALYGFLNLIAAIETWASPDFRPTFKIPRAFPVIGALTSFVVMVQLDIIAMLLSGAILIGIYVLLQRRELRLEAGDTWEGVWATVVRSGLHRLSQGAPQARNWRPNILAFSRMARTTGTRPYLLNFGQTMVRGRGLFTDIVLVPPELKEHESRSAPTMDAQALPVGMFHHVLHSDADSGTVRDMCRYHGVIGLRPNAVLLDWSDFCPRADGSSPGDDTKFEGMFRAIVEQDLSLMLFRYDPERGFGARRRIDVWWSSEGGNLPFALSLLRFIISSNEWPRVEIRVLIFSEDVADNEHLLARASGLVTELRIDATIRAVNVTPEEASFSALLEAQSKGADLVVMGAALAEQGVSSRLERDLAPLGTALVYRAASSFEPVLTVRRAGTTAASMAAIEDAPEIEFDLNIDRHPDIYPPSSHFGRRLAGMTSTFDKRAIQRVYEAEIELIERVHETLERHFNLLEKGVTGSHARRLRRATNRANSSLLKAAKTLLNNFLADEVPRQESTLENRLRELLEVPSLVQLGVPLMVERTAEDFAVTAEDDRWTRRFKRRRRLLGAIQRREPSYAVDLSRLQAWHRERFVNDVVARVLQTMRADGHSIVSELGQLLQSAQTSMALVRGLSGTASVEEYVAEAKQRALETANECLHRHREHHQRTRELLWSGARTVAQGFADDLSRVDVTRLIRRHRRPKQVLEKLGANELEALALSVEHRGQIVEQAQLGLSIADVQHRIAGMVLRIRESKYIELRSGRLDDLVQLQTSLENFSEALGEENPPELKGRFDFRNRDRAPRRESVESLQRELPSVLEDLPETVRVLDGASYSNLLEGSEEVVNSIELPLRRLVSYLIENELMSSLQGLLGGAMTAEEQRGRTVGLDVVRMVRFHRKEWDTLSEEGDDAGSFLAHMEPVVQKAQRRVGEEVEKLEQFASSLAESVDNELDRAMERTQLRELIREAGRLLQDRRRSQGLQAYTGVTTRLDALVNKVSERAISAIYGGQSVLSFARTVGASASGEPLAREEVLSRIQALQPRTEVLKELPYYYRQLFIGQSSTDEAFWIARSELQTQARRGLANHKRGIPGVLVVTGTRGSGKSAFVQWMTSGPLNNRKIYRIFPRRSGSSDPAVLDRVFESETGIVGTLEDQLRALPEQSVIVLRDFELWWTRLGGDDGAIHRLLDAFDAHAGRLVFVVEVGRSALELMDHLYGLRSRALAVMDCKPVGMHEISEIILARHLSAGLSLEVDGTPLPELSALPKARMFALIQERSGGNIGQALRAWVAAISHVEDEALFLTVPARIPPTLVGKLSAEEEAMLVSFEVHRALTKVRIGSLLDADPRAVEEVLGGLVRSGLVEESSPEVFEVSKFAYMTIWRYLHARGLVC